MDRPTSSPTISISRAFIEQWRTTSNRYSIVFKVIIDCYNVRAKLFVIFSLYFLIGLDMLGDDDDEMDDDEEDDNEPQLGIDEDNAAGPSGDGDDTGSSIKRS